MLPKKTVSQKTKNNIEFFNKLDEALHSKFDDKYALFSFSDDSAIAFYSRILTVEIVAKASIFQPRESKEEQTLCIAKAFSWGNSGNVRVINSIMAAADGEVIHLHEPDDAFYILGEL